MEFVVEKKDLLREIQTITGVVERRATLPILANVLIEANDDGLLIGASDLEVTIRARAKADVKRSGGITLPAAKLQEIARSLPDAPVQFKVLDGNQVSIKCKRVKYKVAGQPREEFPAFPQIDLDEGINIPGKALHGMIERVTFAITAEDPRYSLHGALFKIADGQLTLVATDGHRLAFVARQLDVAAPGGEMTMILPRKALTEVSKLTADFDDQQKIILGKASGEEGRNQVFFAVGDYKLTTSMVEGTFPRYESVLPEASDTKVNIDRSEFSDAVQRVSLMSNDRQSRAVRLTLSPGQIDLSSQAEVGEAQETVPVEYDGAEVAIGFNPKYLIDFLKVVGSATVQLELNPVQADDEGRKAEPGDRPGQFRPEPEEGLDYRYIVMPMHL